MPHTNEYMNQGQEKAHPAKPGAIYVFTPRGLETAAAIAGRIPADVFAARSLEKKIAQGGPAIVPGFFASLPELMRRTFFSYACHIFISAAGIAVRAVAPLLESKLRDPAVLVIDQRARFVISLLSGHLGGANAMAAQIAGILGAVPVITTATDGEGLPAIDSLAVERGLRLANPGAVKAVSAALLAGSPVGLHDPADWLGLNGSEWGSRFIPLLRGSEQAAAPGIVVDVRERSGNESPDVLTLHPPALAVGVGCKRGTGASAILALLRKTLAEHGLAEASLRCLASIDAKKDEAGLLAAARALQIGLRLYGADELNRYPVTAVSRKAEETFGVRGVCEPAALAAAGDGGGRPPALLVPKVAADGVTLAVALRRGL